MEPKPEGSERRWAMITACTRHAVVLSLLELQSVSVVHLRRSEPRRTVRSAVDVAAVHAHADARPGAAAEGPYIPGADGAAGRCGPLTDGLSLPVFE